MNLYQINEEIRYICDNAVSVDTETGEITDNGVAAMLENLHAQEEEKLDNTACYVKNLLAEAAALRDEEKALAARRQAKERKAAHLQAYLSGYMVKAGRERFESPRCALSFRRSQRVEIVDKDLLAAYSVIQPDVYRYRDPEVNKSFIAKLLKGGDNVPGAELVDGQNLQIK